MTRGKMISSQDLDLNDSLSARRETLTDVIDVVQKEYIDRALEKTGGNISRAARELGISRVTLYDLLNKLNIKISDYRKTPIRTRL